MSVELVGDDASIPAITDTFSTTSKAVSLLMETRKQGHCTLLDGDQKHLIVEDPVPNHVYLQPLHKCNSHKLNTHPYRYAFNDLPLNRKAHYSLLRYTNSSTIIDGHTTVPGTGALSDIRGTQPDAG
jgi:hypothetical protein